MKEEKTNMIFEMEISSTSNKNKMEKRLMCDYQKRIILPCIRLQFMNESNIHVIVALNKQCKISLTSRKKL